MKTASEVIKEQFNKLNQQFKYFKKNSKHTGDCEQQFIELVNLYDKQDGQHTDKAYEQAYKLLVLFGRNDLKTSMDALTRYVKNFNFKDKKNNLDEIVDFSLPVCADNLHLPTWWVSIMVNGPQATKLFEYATAIQNMLGYTPKTFEEIKKAVAQIKYARFKENPELAELWQQYELPEDGFNRALEYKPNPIDIIPDASIRGAGDDERYHLVKLPSNDLNAYVLGKIVHCCQYVGAEGEVATREGIQYDTNGFYVLLKSKKGNEQEPPINEHGINYKKFDIVGEGYAWLNDGDNLTIDSWENLRATDNSVAVRLLKDFGQQIIKENPGIMRVTIGSGSKTPPECGDVVLFAESMLNGKQYNDSWQQRLLAVDQNRVDKIKEELSSAPFRFEAEKQFMHLKQPQKHGYLSNLKFLKWRGSFLNTYVFNEDFYSSNNYSEWIKGIFVDPKMQMSLNTLFQAEREYSIFCDYLAKRGPVVWKSLYMLSKNGFNMDEIFNQQFFVCLEPNVADIFVPLIELKQNGLLKHPMFKRGGMFEDYLAHFSHIHTEKNLKNYLGTPRSLSNALIELHKHEKLFADKYVKILLRFGCYYEECAKLMIQLEKASLLDRYLELIEKNNPIDVMRAVNNLYQYTILDKCEQVIRGCSKHTYSWVSGALIKLHENGLLDTYLPFLEQYPDKANLAEVCYALVNLHHVPEKTILSGDLQAFNNIDLTKLLKSLQNNTVPVDEQITIQKQPEDVSMEPSTFSLRQFLANLWQGLKNTVNRLIRFVTSLFTYSTDERVQTDMGHRFVDETRDPITEDSYSRMANNITLNSDDSAAIAQSANNSATNRTTVEPPVPDRNETRTAVREEHEEEPISIRSFL